MQIEAYRSTYHKKVATNVIAWMLLCTKLVSLSSAIFWCVLSSVYHTELLMGVTCWDFGWFFEMLNKDFIELGQLEVVEEMNFVKLNTTQVE